MKNLYRFKTNLKKIHGGLLNLEKMLIEVMESKY